MKKNLTPIAIAVALSLAPAAAWAEVQDRSGGYAVVGLGKTKTEANGKKIDVNQSKPKVGNGKFNYTVGGGYRLNDYFAIETNVHGQAGDRKKKSSRDKNPKSNGEVGSLNTRAYTVSGLVIMPVGEHVELFGRAGVGRMNTRFTPTAGSDIGKASSSGMATQFGAGANFYVGEDSFVRTEWTMLRGKGNDDVAKALGRNKLVSSGVMVSYGHNF